MPRFVVTLEAREDVEAPLVRVPLAVTGKWARGASEFSINLRDLEEIYRNFNARQNGEINVDYDHASEMPEVAAGGPIPSAGRIVKLDPPEPLTPSPSPSGRGEQEVRATRYQLWGWYEPTERARALIRHREYRYISPAIDWTAHHKRTGKPQGTTLTSVALTNRPFLEEMPPIRLSDPSYQLVDDTGDVGEAPRGASARSAIQAAPVPAGPEGGATRVAAPLRAAPESPAQAGLSTEPDDKRTGGLMKKVNLSVADGKIRIAHEDWRDAYFAAPEELRPCLEELGWLAEATLAAAIKTLAGRPAAPLSECVAELGQRLARPGDRPQLTLAQAKSLLSEAEAEGKGLSAAEFFRAEVERELEEAVQHGKVLPRQRDDWRRIALSDLPTFRKLMGAQKRVVPLRPVGFSGAPPENVQVQVKLLAEQRMRERNISFGQALTDLGREQPELLREYRRAVSGSE